MANIPLVRAQQCYPFTDFLANSGLPVTRLLEQFRIPAKMLDLKDLFIDESRLWRLTEYIGRREGLPDIGLHVGKDLTLTQLGDFGELLLRQPTLCRAIQTCCEFISAESVLSVVEMRWRDEYYWLRISHLPDAPPIHKAMELYNLQALLKIIQSAAGGNWLPPAVELTLPALPAGLRLEDLSNGPIYFSQPASALAIPQELLSMPMNGFEADNPETPGVKAVLKWQTAPTIDFETSLRWLIKGYLDESLTVYDLAELIGMGRRTLQRRLSEAGTSFQCLLDQARFEVAGERLRTETETPITEIAFCLGYRDLANFTRAFKRWAGVSPRQFRMSQHH